MWYFSWILGVAFAGTFAILNALWFEANTRRELGDTDTGHHD